MASYLNDFIDFFNLSDLLGSTTLTVQNVLGLSILAFIGCIITLTGIRCIFEIIKIVTDWSRFR